MTSENIVTDHREYLRTDESWEPYILDLANQHLADHGLDIQDWTVKFIDSDPELDNGSAGYCWPRGRLIFLTREYLLDTDERNVQETILHEIAHALAGVEHNEVWRDKLSEIGGSGIWYLKDGSTAEMPIKD